MDDNSNEYDIHLRSGEISEGIRLSLDDPKVQPQFDNLDDSNLEQIKQSILKYQQAIK